MWRNHINIECLSGWVFGCLHRQLLYSSCSLTASRPVLLDRSCEWPGLLVDQILVELSLSDLALRERLVLRLCFDLLQLILEVAPLRLLDPLGLDLDGAEVHVSEADAVVRRLVQVLVLRRDHSTA
jgi:hypothetical protein